MMKQKLSIKENIFIGSMLFGLFFGAGKFSVDLFKIFNKFKSSII
jgi:hypothetical protein